MKRQMKRLALAVLLLTASLAHAEPLWWQAPAGPVYQVLVYSFADSDGDGKGDLSGLTHRLNALKTLGVTALWLSPIHPSPSYHGYDVTDYQAVHPDLGTLEDFDRLVTEAHTRGIRLILDMVFNHTSAQHPWFRTRPDWYVTKKSGVDYTAATMGGWHRRSDGSAYFATFWDQMPDLDVANPQVVEEQKAVLKFWLDRGADGFRFDASNHILGTGKVEQGFPVVAKTKEWWNLMRDYARSINPSVYFIGEVSTTSNLEIRSYAGAFDGLFDFVQAKALLVDLPTSGAVPKLVATLEANYKMYARTPGFVISPFLSNHDQDRAMSVTLAKFDAPGQYGVGPALDDVPAVTAAKDKALARYKDLAFLVHTLPGLPYLYYGEELGMTGRRYQNDDVGRRDALPWGDDDPAGDTVTWTRTSGKLEGGQNRSTVSWHDQDADPDSLLNWYRTLGRLRENHPALRGQGFAACGWPGANAGTVAAYFRQGGGETLLAAVNLGWEPSAVTAPAGTRLSVVASLKKQPETEGSFTLAPGQAVLWSVNP